jgi:hypothetical protein
MKENGAWRFENNQFGENGLTIASTPTVYCRATLPPVNPRRVMRTFAGREEDQGGIIQCASFRIMPVDYDAFVTLLFSELR